jgi:hypothetical protein
VSERRRISNEELGVQTSQHEFWICLQAPEPAPHDTFTDSSL